MCGTARIGLLLMLVAVAGQAIALRQAGQPRRERDHESGATGSPRVQFAQRTYAAHTAPMLPDSVNLPVYNAFVFASVRPVNASPPQSGAAPARGYYFRTVLNQSTFPVIGAAPQPAPFCSFPVPPNESLYAGSYSWMVEGQETCLTGSTSASTLKLCMASAPPGVPMNMTLVDGPASQANGEGVALHMTAFGSAYEFNTSLSSTGERVVYREVLARVEGVMFGQAVEGWGGVDAYFGTKAFGSSFVFNDVEEDWLLWADDSGVPEPQYGLVLAGSGGFSGGYAGVQGATGTGASRGCAPGAR